MALRHFLKSPQVTTFKGRLMSEALCMPHNMLNSILEYGLDVPYLSTCLYKEDTEYFTNALPSTPYRVPEYLKRSGCLPHLHRPSHIFSPLLLALIYVSTEEEAAFWTALFFGPLFSICAPGRSKQVRPESNLVFPPKTTGSPHALTRQYIRLAPSLRLHRPTSKDFRDIKEGSCCSITFNRDGNGLGGCSVPPGTGERTKEGHTQWTLAGNELLPSCLFPLHLSTYLTPRSRPKDQTALVTAHCPLVGPFFLCFSPTPVYSPSSVHLLTEQSVTDVYLFFPSYQGSIPALTKTYWDVSVRPCFPPVPSSRMKGWATSPLAGDSIPYHLTHALGASLPRRGYPVSVAGPRTGSDQMDAAQRQDKAGRGRRPSTSIHAHTRKLDLGDRPSPSPSPSPMSCLCLLLTLATAELAAGPSKMAGAIHALLALSLPHTRSPSLTYSLTYIHAHTLSLSLSLSLSYPHRLWRMFLNRRRLREAMSRGKQPQDPCKLMSPFVLETQAERDEDGLGRGTTHRIVSLSQDTWRISSRSTRVLNATNPSVPRYLSLAHYGCCCRCRCRRADDHRQACSPCLDSGSGASAAVKLILSQVCRPNLAVASVRFPAASNDSSTYVLSLMAPLRDLVLLVEHRFTTAGPCRRPLAPLQASLSGKSELCIAYRVPLQLLALLPSHMSVVALLLFDKRRDGESGTTPIKYNFFFSLAASSPAFCFHTQIRKAVYHTFRSVFTGVFESTRSTGGTARSSPTKSRSKNPKIKRERERQRDRDEERKTHFRGTRRLSKNNWCTACAPGDPDPYPTPPAVPFLLVEKTGTGSTSPPISHSRQGPSQPLQLPLVTDVQNQLASFAPVARGCCARPRIVLGHSPGRCCPLIATRVLQTQRPQTICLGWASFPAGLDHSVSLVALPSLACHPFASTSTTKSH
ncbi:uncharacterized protein CLUP02_12364 [Colletotrichum lupini]|uniref:Uncharacterized protein n=1 Tax=Colletotrichum lupini TaxID=145971 RepID=A0A9Q8T0F4_9PEZI|nr:uncharacterized protein CLUP02_12364 [Colletotrichum lupini]UQC86862.1 hypothetical protein CLUP02_12364 [Colletotrichum lupini]